MASRRRVRSRCGGGHRGLLRRRAVNDPRPRSVSKFEARLLTIIRATVRLSPTEPALPYLFDKMPLPPALSTSCLEMVCDGLATGCVLHLARVGGWRQE